MCACVCVCVSVCVCVLCLLTAIRNSQTPFLKVVINVTACWAWIVRRSIAYSLSPVSSTATLEVLLGVSKGCASTAVAGGTLRAVDMEEGHCVRTACC